MTRKPPLLPVGIDEFFTLFLKRFRPKETPKSFEASISWIACCKSDLRSLYFLESAFASLRKLSLNKIFKAHPKVFL